MNRIEEANGKTLLDNILFIFGSGLGDGSTHQYSALPILMAGSGGGRFITGKHLNVSAKSGLVKKLMELTKHQMVVSPYLFYGSRKLKQWVLKLIDLQTVPEVFPVCLSSF